MAASNAKEEIDTIMAEMEAQTPRSSGTNKSFDKFNGNSEEIPNKKEPDDVDAVGRFSSNFFKDPVKPGKLHPSRPTDERYYDFSGKNMGVALIFNQVRFKGEQERKGSQKDADDLSGTLSAMGFDVKVFTDYTYKKIKTQLNASELIISLCFLLHSVYLFILVSRQDHSDNDCLFVTIMTHGKRGGEIYAADGEFDVQDLWTPFIGSNCESLIGKPKLFFIQACRGNMTDPGVLLKPKLMKMTNASDTVDAKPVREEFFVIPTLADLLVMYSTAEGFYAFRNPTDGSWFIQALCEELKENHHEDLLLILTGVNRRVAFPKQSNIPDRSDWDAMKQMPNIVSMLTKTFYFTKKSVNFQLENA